MLYDYLIKGIGHRSFNPNTARKLFDFFGYDIGIIETRIRLNKFVWEMTVSEADEVRWFLERQDYVDLEAIWVDVCNIRKGHMCLTTDIIRRICFNESESHDERGTIIKAMLDGIRPLEPLDWVKPILGKSVMLNAAKLYGMGFGCDEVRGIVKWRKEKCC